jgi:lipoate-protein ligase A
VEKVTCRLLPFAVADGPHNMAADEVLLLSAQEGQTSVRFYGWSEATVSLGYFQPAAARDLDPKLHALPFVRRPTGGAVLVHHHELTYALALSKHLCSSTREPWLVRIHRIIAGALTSLGVDCRLAEQTAKGQHCSILCFEQITAGDILLGGRKIAGSAQRRQKGSLLQHGAILLKASSYAPWLLGIWNLTGHEICGSELQAAILHEFIRDTGWNLLQTPWETEEQNRIRLTAEKFASSWWNTRR